MQLSFVFFLAWSNLIIPGTLSQSVPSSPYAPERVSCNPSVKVRNASEGLATTENDWREKRLTHVVQSLHSYLPRANISGFNLTSYLKALNASNAPVVGMSISGGGTQSGLGGLGLWQAFDERYPPAVEAGIGGLTQCISYLSGLSGGGFSTVAPLAASNFSSIATLRKYVNFTTNFYVGPTGNATEWYGLLFENAGAKAAQGFPVSAVDILGQLWRQYLPKSWAYRNFSEIASQSNHSFALGTGPMPILALAEVVPGSSPTVGNIMSPGLNSSKLTSYEITPFEFGSWIGGRIQAFMPTRFIGSSMNRGKPETNQSCVVGFDKVTWVQGTTGNAFNLWLIDAFYNIQLFAKRSVVAANILGRRAANNSIPIPPGQEDNQNVALIEEFSEVFNQSFNDSLWSWLPNPFLNYNKAMTGVSDLLLVDGSETGETDPLRPLIQKQRKLDFIINYDSSLDGQWNYVNGTNFIDTSAVAAELGLPFPVVPDAATMINLNMTTYPTFFGCHDAADVPLVLYIPNAPWTAYTNYSYALGSFTDQQLDLVFNNSLAAATYGLGTLDSEWPACVACGVIYKSLSRVGMALPDVCHRCFDRHCWNGTGAEKPSRPVVDPRLILEPNGPDYAVWNATVWSA